MDDLQAFFHAVGATPNPGATAAELAGQKTESPCSILAALPIIGHL